MPKVKEIIFPTQLFIKFSNCADIRHRFYNMNILLLGSGGREHALAWKLSQSPLCKSLFIAPGNAGTEEFGTNLDINVNDFAAIEIAANEYSINMIIVGPEEPLVNGIYDHFRSNKDVIVVGPSANGAQLEGSKAFSKQFMQRHDIPTAGYAEFTRQNFEKGKEYISKHSLPIVLKADGLAAGKGVVIAETHEEALRTFEEMIINEQFGKASSKVVIEEFLQGIEVSVFALTDGKNYKIIGHAKDYKRIGEGDTGPNTGGMGCVTPVPFINDVFMKRVEERIIQPTINGLHKENIEYKGFVFFGLMNVEGEPYVIEYNCRMGDPETEVVMPRLKNDLVELFVSMHEGRLNEVEIEYDDRCIATVMAVSGGYPGEYEKNLIISQFDSVIMGDSIIFHAGTKKEGADVLTNGGRVLAVTSYGVSLQDAVTKSRKVLEQVSFEGMYYRKDIGYEFSI
jgi:phosphoribosylamine---glycine ligase